MLLDSCAAPKFELIDDLDIGGQTSVVGSMKDRPKPGMVMML